MSNGGSPASRFPTTIRCHRKPPTDRGAFKKRTRPARCEGFAVLHLTVADALQRVPNGLALCT